MGGRGADAPKALFYIMERAENFYKKRKRKVIRDLFWTGIMIQIWYVKIGNSIKKYSGGCFA